MDKKVVMGSIHELNNSSGRIYVDGDRAYFFHKNDLTNCNIRNLVEGDVMEFNIEEDEIGRKKAINVRKKYQADSKSDYIKPGIHTDAKFDNFNSDERSIIQNLSKIFYVTHGGKDFLLSGSSYRYCLVKPTEEFVNTFQMSREIVVIFSDYVNLEPRDLDAAPYVYGTIQSQLRLDRGCHILISHDNKIETKLVELLRDNNLNQIVIPFCYSELIGNSFNPDTFKDRFRNYLFDTDLFSTSKPIQNDIFFFGRRDLVHDIVSKCKQNTNCGVFGLRRSGKTSVLYAVEKLLKQQIYPTVFVPCESDLSVLDWRAALCKLVHNIAKSLNVSEKKIDDDAYQSLTTVFPFEADMDQVLSNTHLPVTIMFDEIEAITFGINQADKADNPNYENQWFDGRNFVNFWNIIRGYQFKNPRKISILVAGTNPMINEVPKINDGKRMLENPMFGQLSNSNQGAYLQAFTIEDTNNMVNTLGGYMGLSFDEYSVSRLTSDCGGHPYLMRLLCSHINKYIRNNSYKKPVKITKAIYDKATPEFEKSKEAEGFFIMVLNILSTSYITEFETLKTLALEGDSTISRVKDREEVLHLLGYGLVDCNQGHYAIKYNTITNYLRGKHKFERSGLSIEEQKEEIQLRLNEAEIRLRKLIKNQLLSRLGRTNACDRVISAMEKNPTIQSWDIEKARDLSYVQLFDTSVNKMYFSTLKQIIVDNYDLFCLVFEDADIQTVQKHLNIINISRRCPDHSYTEDAENWSWNDFLQFRESMGWLESILLNYE